MTNRRPTASRSSSASYGRIIFTVERIDKDIQVLEAQLQDENISETRRSVIPQHIEDTRAKLKEQDNSLNALCADVDAVIADLRGLSDKLAERRLNNSSNTKEKGLMHLWNATSRS